MERVPVLYFARTDLEAELLINWEDVGTTNISFSKEPQYFAAVVFSKVSFFLSFDLVKMTSILFYF